MPEEQPIKIQSEQLLKLCHWLFDRFCEDAKIPDARRPAVNPLAFVNWFAESNTNDGGYKYDPAQLADQLQIEPAVVQFLQDMLHTPGGVNQMMSVWPYMILAKRECRHPLLSINLLMILTWQDGVCFPLSIYSHRQTNSTPIQDAEVVQLLTTRPAQLSNQVLQHGLDGLHNDHRHMVGVGDSGVIDMIEAMLQNSPVKLEKEMFNKVNAMLGLMRTLFPGEVPEEIRQKMAAARQVAEGGTAGGWEEG